MTNFACKDITTYYPIQNSIPGMKNQIGILMLISGILSMVMSIVTVLWIRSKKITAEAGSDNDEAVKSVIFPVFVNLLWFSVAAGILIGLVAILIPINETGENCLIASVAYALVLAIQHAIVEGVAFLLMQKGCGKHAAMRVTWWVLMWSAMMFIVTFFALRYGGDLRTALAAARETILLIFYFAVCFYPTDRLFRRPACILYGKCWLCFRLLVMVFNILTYVSATKDISLCGFYFLLVIVYAVIQPLIMYWTLSKDSDWWQGIDISSNLYQRRGSSANHSRNGNNSATDDLRYPLMGTEYSLGSAQSLAGRMDDMRMQGNVKMLNFACIKLQTSKPPLGRGSFSKVYRGTYRGTECAIKLIYTMDLTEDTIQRVAAEASILSSIRNNPNVVNIMGVTVLPPSVCLILELCSFGSMSDIIRGKGFDWNNSSMSNNPIHNTALVLSYPDMLHLALGCARGLAAVHAYDRLLCHRDIKSFNFLVDHQFNVKIADLELGAISTTRNTKNSRASSSGNSSTIEEGGDYNNESLLSDRVKLLYGYNNNNNNSGGDSSYNRRRTSKIMEDGYCNDYNNNSSHNRSTSTFNLSSLSLSLFSSIKYQNDEQQQQQLDDPDELDVNEILANWLAPEVLIDKQYQQASDVYALGTVLWEIISEGLIPYDNDKPALIRRKIVAGYTHPIPTKYAGSAIAMLIAKCWSYEPRKRPTSADIATILETMLSDQCYSCFKNVDAIPDCTSLVEFYENSYKRNITHASSVNTVDSSNSSVNKRFRYYNINRRSSDEDNVTHKSGGYSMLWSFFQPAYWFVANIRSALSSHNSSSSSSNSNIVINTTDNYISSDSIYNPINNHKKEIQQDSTYAKEINETTENGDSIVVGGKNNKDAIDGKVVEIEEEGGGGELRSSLTLSERSSSSSSSSTTCSDCSSSRSSSNSIDNSEGGGSGGWMGYSSVYNMLFNKEESSNRGRTYSNISSGSFDMNGYYSLPQTDIENKGDDNALASSNNTTTSHKIANKSTKSSSNEGERGGGYIVSDIHSSNHALHTQVPRTALNIIGIIKEESYWAELEASGAAWAVVTVTAPHVIMHATATWYKLFRSEYRKGSYQHMLSLMSIINGSTTTASYNDVDDNNMNVDACTYSNDYVKDWLVTNSDNNNNNSVGGSMRSNKRKYNRSEKDTNNINCNSSNCNGSTVGSSDFNRAANVLLSELRNNASTGQYKQLHGVLCFSLPAPRNKNKRTNLRRQQSRNSGSSSSTSHNSNNKTSSNYSSSNGAGHRHHAMCSLHIYPVYAANPISSDTHSNNNSDDSISENNSTNSLLESNSTTSNSSNSDSNNREGDCADTPIRLRHRAVSLQMVSMPSTTATASLLSSAALTVSTTPLSSSSALDALDCNNNNNNMIATNNTSNASSLVLDINNSNSNNNNTSNNLFSNDSASNIPDSSNCPSTSNSSNTTTTSNSGNSGHSNILSPSPGGYSPGRGFLRPRLRTFTNSMFGNNTTATTASILKHAQPVDIHQHSNNSNKSSNNSSQLPSPSPISQFRFTLGNKSNSGSIKSKQLNTKKEREAAIAAASKPAYYAVLFHELSDVGTIMAATTAAAGGVGTSSSTVATELSSTLFGGPTAAAAGGGRNHNCSNSRKRRAAVLSAPPNSGYIPPKQQQQQSKLKATKSMDPSAFISSLGKYFSNTNNDEDTVVARSRSSIEGEAFYSVVAATAVPESNSKQISKKEGSDSSYRIYSAVRTRSSSADN